MSRYTEGRGYFDVRKVRTVPIENDTLPPPGHELINLHALHEENISASRTKTDPTGPEHDKIARAWARMDNIL